MFGRRRRRLAESAALVNTPPAVLSDAQILNLLHSKISSLVGETGAWTLVPRSAHDTEVIFHGLKAREIAVDLTEAVLAEQAALRGETIGEPTALSFTPAPITTWSEPAGQTVSLSPGAEHKPTTTPSRDSAPAATTSADAIDEELAAASAAWINTASATLASARRGA